MKSSQNILVVGANSFVGSFLINELKKNNLNRITGIYHKNTDNLHSDITNISVSDIETLPNNFNQVYLISAFVPMQNYLTEQERKLLYETNIELTNTICLQFTNAKIIYCSSVSVFSVSNNVIDEYSPIAGLNEYGISKLWAEKVVKSSNQYAILRFSSIYGKDMKTNTFLPNCIKQAITNDEIVIYGKGERLQDYIHVSDVVRYLISAAQCPTNEIFLGVYGKSFSNLEIAKIISQITGCGISFKDDDHSPSFVYNNNYTCKTLSCYPKMDINNGINSLIEWFKKY